PMKSEPGALAYTVTFVQLLILATLSLALASAHPKVGGLGVAMGVGAAKTLLVLLVFMPLWVERFSVRVTLVTSVLFLGLLVGFVALDVGTRHTLPARPRPSRVE